VKRPVAAVLAALLIALAAIVVFMVRHDSRDTHVGCLTTSTSTGPQIDLGVQASTRGDEIPSRTVTMLVASAKEAGATIISTTVHFDALQDRQGEPPQYDGLDLTAQAAHAAGLKLRVTVYGMPAWDYDQAPTGNGIAAPRSSAELARWRAHLTALLEHLRGRLDYLEVWPEPNTEAYWSSGPEPTEYIRLLQESRKVVQAASPRTRIISGGLSGNDFAFLDGMYEAAGTKLPFDLLGVHLYGAGDSSVDAWLRGYRSMHELGLEHGHDVPVYLTSMGYSAWDHVDDSERAQLIPRAFDAMRCTRYVTAASWYFFHPTPWDHEKHTLLDSDLQPTKSWHALADWARKHQKTSPTVAPTAH
jgi:hypothetical protein